MYNVHVHVHVACSVWSFDFIVFIIIDRGEIRRPDYLPGLTGKTGLERLREEADKREEELAKQLKLGQRVLVQVKKSSKRKRRREVEGTLYISTCIYMYCKGIIFL